MDTLLADMSGHAKECDVTCPKSFPFHVPVFARKKPVACLFGELHKPQNLQKLRHYKYNDNLCLPALLSLVTTTALFTTGVCRAAKDETASPQRDKDGARHHSPSPRVLLLLVSNVQEEAAGESWLYDAGALPPTRMRLRPPPLTAVARMPKKQSPHDGTLMSALSDAERCLPLIGAHPAVQRRSILGAPRRVKSVATARP